MARATMDGRAVSARLEACEPRTFLSAANSGQLPEPPGPVEEVVVYEPHAKVGGMKLGEWGARWWQWALSYSASENPLYDETGDQAHLGDQGGVFFLAGVFNESGTATRQATVPSDHLIFFPILNGNLQPIETGLTSVAKIRNAVARYFDDPVLGRDYYTSDLSTTITPAGEAEPVLAMGHEDLLSHRAAGGPVKYTLPEDNILTWAGGTAGTHHKLMSDGYWLMLQLPEGQYTLDFSGSISWFDADGVKQTFTLSITYNLDVVAPEAEAPVAAAASPFSAGKAVRDSVLAEAGGVLD